MDVIDKQTRAHKIQIINEPDNETDLMYVGKMKK